jgi:DNA-binding winged helix-turn-helix (wHTH) protein
MIPALEPPDSSRSDWTLPSECLDLRCRTLSCEGSLIEIKSKAFDILSALASAQGNLVTKGELMAKVWPRLVVEESNIQVHISALRKALGEDMDRPVHLFTVSGRGYRLVDVPVETAVERPVLPDRPSIVILPFTNMGGDPEQDYFADGIAEEITTVLSRFTGGGRVSPRGGREPASPS